MSLKSPRKILAIKIRAMGDTVLMTAPLAELRRAFPEAEIHALVTAPWAPLLEGHPAVDRVIPFERRKDVGSRARALARTALTLRRERYDWAVNFHASPSSATLAFATGAGVRSVHFHGHRDRNRYSTVEVPGKGVLKPVIERDMDAVRALGIHVPVGRLPRIHLQAGELSKGRERLAQLAIGTPALAIGLGASRPTKSWPVTRYAALALEWCRRTGGGAVALVSEGETELEREFLLAVDEALGSLPSDERRKLRSRVATERGLPLRALASLVSACSVFVGNDSGPKHLAVASEAPTVTLFGPEHPFEWHPYPKDLHPFLFVEGLPCRRDADPGMPPWCSLHECVEERHRCMGMIGVDSVLDLCLKQAERPSQR